MHKADNKCLLEQHLACYQEFKQELALRKAEQHFDCYQDIAAETALKEGSCRERTISYVLGLTGEAGEVADLVKKWLYHGHEVALDQLVGELGDVLWYLTALADNWGIKLSEVAQYNIDKLRKRYPEGFSKDASRNRESDPWEI